MACFSAMVAVVDCLILFVVDAEYLLVPTRTTGSLDRASWTNRIGPAKFPYVVQYVTLEFLNQWFPPENVVFMPK